jgi:DNA-binding response OmpR family regulator
MKNVIVLDNDLYFANTLKLYFQKQNIACTICDNGNQAIDYLSENQYDLIICSTQLGHKSGLELSIFLKGKLNQKNTPFVLITPNNNASMNSYFTELQPSAILHKPVSFQTLMSTIETLQNQETLLG